MFFVNSIFFRWWNWIFFHLLPKLDGDVELISHDERFLVKIQFNIIHHHRSPVLPPKRNLHNFYVHQNNNNIGGSERGEKYQLATWPFLEYANRTHTQRTEMVLIESHWGERERPPSSLSSCKTKSFVFDALFFAFVGYTSYMDGAQDYEEDEKTPENIIIINRHVKRERER